MAGNAVIGALRVSLGLDTAQFEDGIKQVQSRLGGIGKSFAALGGSAIFAGFIAGLGGAVSRIEEMRKLSAQLDKTLANTGNAARTSAKEVEQFADKLERSTGRAAEDIMEVSTNLATFGFGREQFFRAIELANDMAAAWGGDLKQNVEGLGRALANPEKGLAMLTKRGIEFDAEQKKMIAGFIKANDLAGAQGVIFDALEGQVKGVAEAGFGGLTKAAANAWKSVEDFFEAIANGIRLNGALEMSLGALTGGIDFLTANLDTVARVAGVAGTALLVALGPAIWAIMSTAAVAFGTAAVGAIKSIGVAIATNPIGFIVMALASAISAAFLFRDNIKQIFGVDIAGIILGAANSIIGAFVGAFEAIKATWSMLPAALGDVVIQGAQAVIDGAVWMLREAVSIINDFLTDIKAKVRPFGMDSLVPLMGAPDDVIPDAKLPNPFAGQAGAVGGAASKAFNGAMSQDYIGDWFSGLFGGGEGEEAPVIKGFKDLTTSIDGAAEATKRLKHEGAQIFEATRTPLEALQIELAKLGKLLKAGAIDFETFGRAALQAKAGAVAAMAGMASQITGTLSQMFKDNKAFAVANAVVSGIEGVAKTLSAYPAPWSFAMAGVQAAAAALQVQSILSTNENSTSMPSTASPATTTPVAQEAGPVVNLEFRGSRRMFSEQDMRDLISQINQTLAHGSTLRTV